MIYLCVIYDFDKKITYMLTDFLNVMHNVCVQGYTNIHSNFTGYLSLG